MLFAGEVFPVKHLRRIAELLAAGGVLQPLRSDRNQRVHVRPDSDAGPARSGPVHIRSAGRAPTARHSCSTNHTDRSWRAVRKGSCISPGLRCSRAIGTGPIENLGAFIERDGLRWYNTGDVVREDSSDGFVYLGRRDRMVKRRGYRIELGEIERGLYQHQSISEAAVVAIPDPSAGVKIIAFLTPQPGERPSIIALKTFCAQSLPSYMNPDVFVFHGIAASDVDK